MKFGTKGDAVPFSAHAAKRDGEKDVRVWDEIPDLLLNWFDRSARNLPWRSVRDPYRVLLSELMLQQTQVATVIPYYERFLEKWPTLPDLAAAEDEAVLKAWEGLGYYSRVRNLLATARMVVHEFGGIIPQGEKELLKLKGIGEYTAGAIRSIAFGLPSAAVDGNVVRVFSRLTATPWQPASPADRRQVNQLVESMIPSERPGDFNEALMDLGATICLPQNPLCLDCPLQTICSAKSEDSIAQYPVKKPIREKPVEHHTCLIITWKGNVHVNRRADSGLLAGLYEFDWLKSLQEFFPAEARSNLIQLGQKRHVFTHKIWLIDGFKLDLDTIGKIQWKTAIVDALDVSGSWVEAETLKDLPFPKALISWRDEWANDHKTGLES